jgi:hypothetical protein
MVEDYQKLPLQLSYHLACRMLLSLPLFLSLSLSFSDALAASAKVVLP